MSHIGPFLRYSLERWPQFMGPPWIFLHWVSAVTFLGTSFLCGQWPISVGGSKTALWRSKQPSQWRSPESHALFPFVRFGRYGPFLGRICFLGGLVKKWNQWIISGFFGQQDFFWKCQNVSKILTLNFEKNTGLFAHLDYSIGLYRLGFPIQ